MSGTQVDAPARGQNIAGLGHTRPSGPVDIEIQLVPALAKPFYTIWYGFAGCVGIVMANLLFMILYYGLFTPFGLFMRLIKRDALDLKRDADATTYWKEAPPERPATHYFRQY